ncbi:MAG: hypothetical protein ACWA44_02570 [Thiotrichales bacterium]
MTATLMTPIELSGPAKKSVETIMKQARRMRTDGLIPADTDLGKDKALPDKVVQFYLKDDAPKSLNGQDKGEASKPPKTKKPRSKKKEEVPAEPDQIDLGELLMFHPTALFVFVIVILSGGAYMFAGLWDRCLGGEANVISFAMFFAIGFLVDASGVILAKRYKRGGKYDKAGGVWFALVLLFLFQVGVEGSYIFYDELTTVADPESKEIRYPIPEIILVFIRPFGQLLYSGIYLNNSQGDKNGSN